MGSDCGYLAMMAGLAGGAEVISTPEFEVSRQDSCNCGDCRRRHKENANKILAYFDADKQRTGFELRTPTLGHVVREAPPSAFDRLLAARLGVAPSNPLPRRTQRKMTELTASEAWCSPSFVGRGHGLQA
jgi:6-phosphofructokinase 1